MGDDYHEKSSGNQPWVFMNSVTCLMEGGGYVAGDHFDSVFWWKQTPSGRFYAPSCLFLPWPVPWSLPSPPFRAENTPFLPTRNGETITYLQQSDSHATHVSRSRRISTKGRFPEFCTDKYWAPFINHGRLQMDGGCFSVPIRLILPLDYSLPIAGSICTGLHPLFFISLNRSSNFLT